MALRTSREVKVFGENMTYDCYTVISSISGNKKSLHMFVTDKRYDDKTITIKTTEYNFVPSVDEDADNFYKQGYEYLKSLDDFADAMDVLEEGQTA